MKKNKKINKSKRKNSNESYYEEKDVLFAKHAIGLFKIVSKNIFNGT